MSDLVRTPSMTPATGAFAITPDDDADLVKVTNALLVGVAGNIKVDMANGNTVTLPVPAGYNPLSVKRVHATGTTATGIFGLVD